MTEIPRLFNFSIMFKDFSKIDTYTRVEAAHVAVSVMGQLNDMFPSDSRHMTHETLPP